MAIALVPGSFDPFTLGHLDLVRRVSTVCESVIVAVTHNPAKTYTLDFDTRLGVIRETLTSEGLDTKVRAEALPDGLLVEGARSLGATHLAKGIRNAQDLSYEEPMARMNMDLAGLDTFFILTAPSLAHVSSSLVREVHALGADVTPYVPAAAVHALKTTRK